MLRDRIFSGIILLAGVLILIAVRGPLLIVGVTAAAVIGALEFYHMARKGGYRPWTLGGTVLTLVLVIEAALARYGWPATPASPGDNLSTGLGVVALLLLATVLVEAVRGPLAGPAWVNVGLTVGGALYTGGLLRLALLLDKPKGTEAGWLLLLLVATAGSDTGAYFVGRALGKRKLIPHISPGKTWAGLWGGMAVAVLGVALLAPLLHIPWLHVLPLGLALNLASVGGDLVESMLKRGFGAKDSGTWIPGHGGLLDRLDSLLFVLTVVYFYVTLFYQA
jgi:phosphatidate cytidylyltransferase